jgi:GT2 family glycosyltransferase
MQKNEAELKVSIVILNWNGKKWIDSCLDSCLNQSYSNIEIIFADNNSTDDSVQYVKEKWKSVKVVELDDNYGYALGNNKAETFSQGDLLFFLNNDTKLFNDCIENLVKEFEKNTILIPKQYVGDFSVVKDIQDYKILLGNGADIFGYPYGVKDFTQQKIFYADGAAFLISKENFLQLGGFDEKLFMFQEDIDLSWRARLINIRIKICPNSGLFHYSGGSAVGGAADKKYSKYITTSFRRYHNEKNIIRNIIKNYSFWTLSIILPVLLAFHILEILFFSLLLKYEFVMCYIRAYKWNYENLMDTLTLRNKIQSGRLVNDITILKNMYIRYSKLTAIARLGLPTFK